MVICNLDQAPPRPVTQEWCGNDHLKPAGFCRLASHRHTFCSFGVEPCLPEDGLQSLRIGVVVTGDQDSSLIRHSQLQTGREAGLVNGCPSLSFKAHGSPPFVCSPFSGEPRSANPVRPDTVPPPLPRALSLSLGSQSGSIHCF